MASSLATSLFSSAQSFLISASTPSPLSAYVVSTTAPALTVGLWKVERATHAANGKVVSIWSVAKSKLAPRSGGGGAARAVGGTGRSERGVETARKEASSLSRLRHPCILEMAEPFEESRSSIHFATEPVISSLRQALASSSSSTSSSSNGSSETILDEVEIQKGMSQIAKGLVFLHESVKLVHRNLGLESVVVNDKGDWKLAGFGHSSYLFGPDGVPAKWEFPEHDHSLPSSCQRDYDYIAPEDLLDESAPSPSNDLYSLGILLHAIHTHSGPPFANHHSLSTARSNIESGLSGGMLSSSWRRLPSEIQSALSQLITRYPSSRLSAKRFLEHESFNNILVSTLRFLEREEFSAKTAEVQTGFLKGLAMEGGVLERFSEKVRRRKVLPALLEECRKPGLVPWLLPCVGKIVKGFDKESFRAEVLPHLKPCFALKEPPQTVIALLDSLPLFNEKCTPAVFRDEVMPLVYQALESDIPAVLEKALRVVPGLSESLDYTTVKGTLFPKITAVFSKTTLLSVKVNTLICFHSMVKTLDKFTLTEKLVPLLAKIKTKEPSVAVATLAVLEETGKKVDIEAIATLILPQLWKMSLGPLLNLNQFTNFMSVIHRLSKKVEDEQKRHLEEVARLEESTAAASGRASGILGAGEGGKDFDFESLVRGNVGIEGREVKQDFFGTEDGGSGRSSPFPTIAPTLTTSPSGPSLSIHRVAPTSSLKAASVLGAQAQPQPTRPNYSPATSASGSTLASFAPTVPSSSSSTVGAHGGSGYGSGRPNYNLSTTLIARPNQQLQPTTSSSFPVLAPTSSSFSYTPSSSSVNWSTPPPPPSTSTIAWNRVPQPSPSAAATPPGFTMGAVLQPTIKTAVKNQGGGAAGRGGEGDWRDLDPLG